MNVKFLSEVQTRGWLIEGVDESSVVARCPNAGCTMRAKLAYGSHVPSICQSEMDYRLHLIDNWAAYIRLIGSRQRKFALSKKDIEEACGLAEDHFGKFGRDQSGINKRHVRMPNLQTCLDLSQTVGLVHYVAEGPLPAATLRQICDTRDKAKSRESRSRSRSRKVGL
tara:strand:- start:470 stop:973 length:504 start_codon:yes stop_codon:yes gene_type:complete